MCHVSSQDAFYLVLVASLIENAGLLSTIRVQMNFERMRWEWRGWLMEVLKRPQDAIAAYKQAYASNTSRWQLAHVIGFLYEQSGNHAEAEAWLVRACEGNPKSGDAWFNLGFIRDKARRWPKAIEAFQKAVALAPNQDRAWYGMGLAQAHLGNHAEAAKALEEAARLQPMNGHAWYALGMAYHHLHEPEQVKRAAEQLAQFDPQRAKVFIRETERADLHHLVAHLD
ncbi:MAG: tetratricopeptide repeat protein [Hydrogenophilaceae bacterium]|nr:tetratricopeptide repeat protein [Hydrogenophilaceae bacterium]